MEGKDSLLGAAQRRSEMMTAMQHLEKTAASPAASETWVDDLTDGVRQLETALNHHIAEVEAPDGLLDQIVDAAPRLHRLTDETRRHHVSLTDATTDLLNTLAGAGENVPVDAIRAKVIDLLNEIARHRQKGADLIHEAYDVDIGGY